jgi:hypothetical protein
LRFGAGDPRVFLEVAYLALIVGRPLPHQLDVQVKNMSSTLSRLFLIVALLAAFGLAACGDSESTQRKAFIDFLQTRILDKLGLHVPMPTEEQTKSFGEYAKQYGIILSFHEGMNKNVSERMRQIFQSGMVRSLDELMTRRADVATARDGMTSLSKALAEELTKADAAHAALKQPEELKAAFDRAYERTVTNPAKAFEDTFPVVDTALQAAQNLASYLDRHRDAIKISGSSIQTSDPKLTTELNDLINALNQNGQAVSEAQRKLQAAIQGI